MTTRITKRVFRKKSISKKTPYGRTLAHLTKTHAGTDRYDYYHGTKGWRSRRIVRSWQLQTVAA